MGSMCDPPKCPRVPKLGTPSAADAVAISSFPFYYGALAAYSEGAWGHSFEQSEYLLSRRVISRQVMIGMDLNACNDVPTMPPCQGRLVTSRKVLSPMMNLGARCYPHLYPTRCSSCVKHPESLAFTARVLQHSTHIPYQCASATTRELLEVEVENQRWYFIFAYCIPRGPTRARPSLSTALIRYGRTFEPSDSSISKGTLCTLGSKAQTLQKLEMKERKGNPKLGQDVKIRRF